MWGVKMKQVKEMDKKDTKESKGHSCWMVAVIGRGWRKEKD